MTRSCSSLVALVVCSLLTGCVAGAAAGDGDDAQIIGGVPETGYPAVGSLMFEGQSGCTGTLVTADAVLTAGHCLAGTTADKVSFAVGADVTSGAANTYPVASLTVHPQYQEGGESGPTYDIAVMRLAQPAAEPPLPFNTDDASTLSGQEVLLVGYGLTARPSEGAEATGIKHSVTIPVQGVSEQFLDFAITDGKTGCFGDSGGPALLDGGTGPVVVGVTSWGDTDCNGEFHYTRTDVFADFVAGAIAGGGDPGQPPDQQPPGGEPPGGEPDPCEEQGWYGDGICDECPQPDPDCEGGGGGGQEGDWCAEQGWYGDGICDECPQPDPDCG
jgi:V8-like Glu-specific endopeptidase